MLIVIVVMGMSMVVVNMVGMDGVIDCRAPLKPYFDHHGRNPSDLNEAPFTPDCLTEAPLTWSSKAVSHTEFNTPRMVFLALQWTGLRVSWKSLRKTSSTATSGPYSPRREPENEDVRLT